MSSSSFDLRQRSTVTAQTTCYLPTYLPTYLKCVSDDVRVSEWVCVCKLDNPWSS